MTTTPTTRLESQCALEPRTATPRGLHEFVLGEMVPRYAQVGARCMDLGAGSGALSILLNKLGLDVLAVDIDAGGFVPELPFAQADCNEADFSERLGPEQFDLIVSIEVLEHVESPINFLRNVARLLKPSGRAIVTTPNVDSLPARLKFLVTGRIRTMDAFSEPTHISPIFLDLFRRQFLPAAGLRLSEHLFFPPRGFQLTRQPAAFLCRALAAILPGEALLGDHHIFVLQRTS